MMEKVDIGIERDEFERLMREKCPSYQLGRKPDGDYANAFTAMVFLGWIMSKAHTKAKVF